MYSWPNVPKQPQTTVAPVLYSIIFVILFTMWANASMNVLFMNHTVFCISMTWSNTHFWYAGSCSSRCSPYISSHSPNLPVKSYNRRYVFIMPTCSYCLCANQFLQLSFQVIYGSLINLFIHTVSYHYDLDSFLLNRSWLFYDFQILPTVK